MLTLRTAAVLALLVAVAGPAAPSAYGCVQDADCDNGDTCSVPDRCDNGTCVLGGGGDQDGDLVCDAEIDPDTIFTLIRAVVRKKLTSGADGVSVRGRGDMFLGSSAGGAFPAADGITVRVRDHLASIPPDGDGIDVVVSWPPAACTTDGVGVITCTDPALHSFARFRPNPHAARQYKVTFELLRLGSATGPFFGPVRMVWTHSGNVHVADRIDDCTLILAGLRCREF